MRNIWLVLALTMAACGGSDGKDGAAGPAGAAGPPGVNGKDGDDGQDGENGVKGADGEDGAPGKDGDDGENGADGQDGAAILKGAGAPGAGLGADGDLYIDTGSRDVYQKVGGAWVIITNLSGGPAGPKGDKGDTGSKGDSGDDGSSVRTGVGAPAPALGSDGDVYIDSTTGDLYAKASGAWSKTGSLKGPAGDDGVDVKDTVGGVRWFAFALNASFVDATATLLTSQTYTSTSSAATFTFTGANQHGRLGFATAGSYLPGGVDLSAFEYLSVSASASGGTVQNLVVLLTDGEQKGCEWTLSAAGGPTYSVNLASPSNCYNDSTGPAFDLESVTDVQIGVVSASSGARTLTVTAIDLIDNI